MIKRYVVLAVIMVIGMCGKVLAGPTSQSNNPG
jgi:hypothetical protein